MEAKREHPKHQSNPCWVKEFYYRCGCTSAFDGETPPAYCRIHGDQGQAMVFYFVLGEVIVMEDPSGS